MELMAEIPPLYVKRDRVRLLQELRKLSNIAKPDHGTENGF